MNKDQEAETSVWGNVFSRHPETGLKKLSAEIHFSEPGDKKSRALPYFSLQRSFPGLAEQLEAHAYESEKKICDAVQFSFQWTGQQLCLHPESKLKRNAQSAIKIAVSLQEDGLLSKEQALLRVEPTHIRQILLPYFRPTELKRVQKQNKLLGTGLGSKCGVASGHLAFNAPQYRELVDSGKNVILACERLSYSERDLLHTIGGAIIREGSLNALLPFERPGIACQDIVIKDGQLLIGQDTLSFGDPISLDSGTGHFFSSLLETHPGALTGDAVTLLKWADETKKIALRANVGSIEEIERAKAMGAEGFGLCRIELIFWQKSTFRLFQDVLREICQEPEITTPSFEQLLEDVTKSLFQLFQAASSSAKPAFILRLLDAPLGPMLKGWQESAKLPNDFFEGAFEIWMSELNPMQGARLGRLSVIYPQLLELQLRAILAAWKKIQDANLPLDLGIMWPGTTGPEEIELLRGKVEKWASFESVECPKVGSMLEVPRACILASELAEHADFLSVGTGDLTEATCGISRYDAQLSFLPKYLDQGFFKKDPFLSIEQKGVGELMKWARESVSRDHPEVELGTCGAQAIEAESLAFCSEINLDYVSVPAHHLPTARLAAARAELLKVQNSAES